MSANEEEDEYDTKIRNILEDLIYHTIKNKPKNDEKHIVNIYIIININFINRLNIWLNI